MNISVLLRRSWTVKLMILMLLDNYYPLQEGNYLVMFLYSCLWKTITKSLHQFARIGGVTILRKGKSDLISDGVTGKAL